MKPVLSKQEMSYNRKWIFATVEITTTLRPSDTTSAAAQWTPWPGPGTHPPEE